MADPNTETSSLKQQLGNGNADGYDIPGPVGFYGATPVDQQSVGDVVDTTVPTSTNPWGFASSTQANDLLNAVADIQTALKNLGISD